MGRDGDAGRDAGRGRGASGAARLGRVLGPFASLRSDEDDGWHERTPSARPDELHGPSDPDGHGVGGRHTVAEPAAGGSRWRLSGVPAGAAVAAVVLAVVAGVLLLGGGPGGTGEVLVGPTAGSSSQESVAADGGARDGGAADGGAGSGVVAVREVPPLAGVQPVEAVSGATGSALPPGSATPPAGPPVPAGPLVVHVDGAVARPGVVTVPAGSRVSDAVEAAGGVTTAADTRMVNLARLLADGELVVVPLPGEEVPVGPGAVAPGPTGGTATGGPPGSDRGAPVDLNAADVVALDALPGIGPVLAERIVAHREEVGPFGSVEDLESVSGIGPSVLSAVRDLVTV